MNKGQTLFSQLMDFVPTHEFKKCVERYRGSYKVQNFSCWDHFLCMAFAQLTYRESLRDIESCLNSQRSKLFNLGFRSNITRSTLSYANNTRDWRIYADFASVLIGIAKDLYRDENFGVEISNTVYALDSTTIDLCLSLFPWATFRKTKAAIKVHTLLDLRGPIPSILAISNGKMHDVNVLDLLVAEPGAIYLIDRGYIDFARLHTLTESCAFFITRSKSNMHFDRISSQSVDKNIGVMCDQIIRLSGFYTSQDYPDRLRRIKYYDTETDKTLVFITNNFLLPSLTIAKLYKCRWQVELFFKWIKQHLRIKSFYGTSTNAVKTQIWIALSIYLIVAIIKKRLKLEASLYTILQILSVSLFEKTHILQALSNIEPENEDPQTLNQLNLFNL
ncbi:MAG: IS4 family transposase [Lentisphaerota bacterium]